MLKTTNSVNSTKRMDKLLIKNIGTLYQTDQGERSLVKGAGMARLPFIENAFVLISKDRIVDFGPQSRMPSGDFQILDAGGRMVMPAWVDAHTHLVFPATREEEFVDKIKGLSYEEIARHGGGILNSAKRTATLTEDELYESAKKRLNEVIQWGTGAIEIKSGYGLSTSEELKMLRVIKRLKNTSQVTIKSTLRFTKRIGKPTSKASSTTCYPK
jgi:imidazolonepropionase